MWALAQMEDLVRFSPEIQKQVRFEEKKWQLFEFENQGDKLTYRIWQWPHGLEIKRAVWSLEKDLTNLRRIQIEEGY